MNPDIRRLSSEDTEALLEALPVGIALVGEGGRVRAVNRALEQQLGAERARLCAGTFDDLPLTRSEHQTGEGQLMLVSANREYATEWVMVHEGPALGGEQGEPLQAWFFLDVTELEHARTRVDRLTQAMRGQVATDNVTGLLNRRAAMNQLESQVSRSRRYHNLLSVVLIHVDCGEAAGGLSEALVLAVGRMLRDQTRWPDIIGRWGDRDFLLILPETSAESARQLQDKVAEQLEHLSVEPDAPPARCSAEFGLAEWRKGDSAGDLVRRAEGAAAEAAG